MECLKTDKGVGSNTAVGRESGGGQGQGEGQRREAEDKVEDQKGGTGEGGNKMEEWRGRGHRGRGHRGRGTEGGGTEGGAQREGAQREGAQREGHRGRGHRGRGTEGGGTEGGGTEGGVEKSTGIANVSEVCGRQAERDLVWVVTEEVYCEANPLSPLVMVSFQDSAPWEPSSSMSTNPSSSPSSSTLSVSSASWRGGEGGGVKHNTHSPVYTPHLIQLTYHPPLPSPLTWFKMLSKVGTSSNTGMSDS